MFSYFSDNEVLIQQTLVYVLLAISLQVVLRCGVVSLASIGFYTLGSYASAIAVKDGWPPVVILPLVALASGLLGYGFGKPLAKLRGLYLAMATLAFDLVIPVLLINGGDLTGGALGIYAIPLAITTSSLFVIVVLVILAVSQIERGWMGRASLALRSDENLARSMGVRVTRERYLAFAISAALGGLAGALSAMLFRAVSPGSGGFALITLGLTMAIVGGRDSWIGAVIGAYLVTWVPEWLRFVGSYRALVFGLVLVVVIMFFPDGLLGAARRLFARSRRKVAPASRSEREAVPV
ncbi:MAG TPA: branched-chain amino acid ABC transporter permease [Mycobacteriales bacterium]|jgi:branched-chain amino acid transport system permease protein